MFDRLGEALRDGLLGFSVICGPAVWLMAIACSYTAWQSGVSLQGTLELLAASFVFGCWALWGLISGPWRVRNWAFLLASILNVATGAWMLRSGEKHSIPVGFLFLAYSLWQFFVFRRRWTFKAE